MFVGNSGSGTVSVINARTAKPIGAPIRVGNNPQGIAFSGTAVWVADTGDDMVMRLDAATGDPIGSPIKVGKDPNRHRRDQRCLLGD